MKTRTWIAMMATGIAYVLLVLPITRARAQGRPWAPRAPQAIPALPALPAMPAEQALSGLPTLPEMPAMRAVPSVPGVPAMPGMPEAPPTPGWGSEPGMSIDPGHWDREPASDCSDLHIRLEDDKPTS